MNTKHVLSITGPIAASWELALVLRRIIIEIGGEAEVFPNSGDVQIVTTCDPEEMRGALELAIEEGTRE